MRSCKRESQGQDSGADENGGYRFFMSWLLRIIGPVVAKSAARDYVRCLKGALRSYAKGTTPGGQLSSPAITRTLASSACTLFGLAGVVSTRLHVLSQVSPRLPWRAGPMSELAARAELPRLLRRLVTFMWSSCPSGARPVHVQGSRST